MKIKFKKILIILTLVILSITGCSSNTNDNNKSGNSKDKEDSIKVVTSFYPMYLLASNVVKDIDNVELINDSGSNALKNIDNMDIAVVGGSGRELEDILEIIDSKLNPKGRIIVTAILVDTKIEAINKLKKLNYNPKIMEVNISNGRVLDRGVMMISENPIAIISANKR